MKAKVLIAGGGIALSAIIPFATLNNFSNSVPVQSVPQFSDLSSTRESVGGEDLSPLIGNSEILGQPEGTETLDSPKNVLGVDDSGSEAGSPSPADPDSSPQKTVDPKILAIFTDPRTKPPAPIAKPVPFQFKNCQEKEIEAGPRKKRSFTCPDQDKPFNQKAFLDEYLKNL